MLNTKNMTFAVSVLALLLFAACAQVEEAAPTGDQCADSLTRCDDENDCTVLDRCDADYGFNAHRLSVHLIRCECHDCK